MSVTLTVSVNVCICVVVVSVSMCSSVLHSVTLPVGLAVCLYVCIPSSLYISHCVFLCLANRLVSVALAYLKIQM